MAEFPRLISKYIGDFRKPDSLFKTESPPFLPFYHVVSDEKLPHILNYPYRNIRQFEKELDFFLKYFDPVAVEDFAIPGRGGKKTFHLSFDDGLRQCADTIAPLLLKKGIPATFFVNTAFLDNKALFHKYKASLILNRLSNHTPQTVKNLLVKNNLEGEKILKVPISQTAILNEAADLLDLDFNHFLKTQKPYLSASQIKELAQKGFSIGAHSHNHPEFEKIPEPDQIKEIKKSIHEITRLIPQKLKLFSFPFTDWGVPSRVLKTIEKENICDLTFGTAGLKYDPYPFHFQRYPVEQPGNFIRNMKAEWVYLELRKWIGKATVKH